MVSFMNTTPRKLMSLVPLAVATAIALAPVAGASSNPVDCRQSGGGTVCQKRGHASLNAEPAVRRPRGGLFGSAWMPGYGRGQLPPLLALD